MGLATSNHAWRASSTDMTSFEAMALDPKASLWKLPILGHTVAEVWFSGEREPRLRGVPIPALYVVAYGSLSDAPADPEDPFSAPRTKVGFFGPFAYTSADGVEHPLNARGAWEALVAVLALRGTRITTATADRYGFLNLEYDDESRLACGPDDRDENWQLSAPGGLFLSAPKGGGDPRILDP